MRSICVRALLRHSLAVSAAILTFVMFAAAHAGRGGPSSLVAVGRGDVGGTVRRYEVELLDVTGVADMRRTVGHDSSGRPASRPIEAETLGFVARITISDETAGPALVEMADCQWSSEARNSADCTVARDGEDEAQYGLRVMRSARRPRDTVILLSWLADVPSEQYAEVRLTPVW